MLFRSGGQQQTIAQNKENYPLTKLASLAALLQGQQIPSTVTTKLNTSPLSALGTLGSGVAGMFTPNAQGVTPWKSFTDAISSARTTLSELLKPDTGGTTEITNNALPGQPGYGWKYYSDGTVISPSGDYYNKDNELIWSPSGNTDTSDVPDSQP